MEWWTSFPFSGPSQECLNKKGGRTALFSMTLPFSFNGSQHTLLCSVSNDFQFCRCIHLFENLFHSFQYGIIQQIFTTIIALRHGQVLQDDDSCITRLEGEVCKCRDHFRSTYMTFHGDCLLLFRSFSHSAIISYPATDSRIA